MASADLLAPPAQRPASARGEPTERPAARGRRRRLVRPTEARVAFLVLLSGYLAVGVRLTLHYGLIAADGISRVANAAYVLDSRDPHLGAIGFVWNPLPSLAEIPLVPFAAVWPALTRSGFAGVIMSAAFMAGAGAVLVVILREWGVNRPVRYLLVGCFALHPLVVYYGADGMSEAPLLFTVMLATRYLARWLRGGRYTDLVRTGLALGLAYATRYEALAPGAAATVLVAVVSLRRASGPFAARRRVAGTDAFLVGAPFVFSVALWAASAKLLVHAWFPTISSEYGNGRQVAVTAAAIRAVTGQGSPAAWLYLGHQVLALEPLIAVVIVAGLLFGLVRSDTRVLAPLAMFGGVFVFDAGAFLTGHSFGWLRFSIAVIPLGVLCAGVLAGARAGRPDRADPRRLSRWGTAGARLTGNATLAVLAIGLVATGLPSGYHVLTNSRLAREESHQLTAILDPAHASVGERMALHTYRVEDQVAAYIDHLHLPAGSVLADSGNAFAVLMASSNMHTFVITSDYDFGPAVADPPRFGVRYLLVPSFTDYGALGAAYPDLYANGAGFATLVRQWKGTGYTPDWRLYLITNPSALQAAAVPD
jgi:hypothetical protein